MNPSGVGQRECDGDRESVAGVIDTREPVKGMPGTTSSSPRGWKKGDRSDFRY